jgi:hypothetical protein
MPKGKDAGDCSTLYSNDFTSKDIGLWDGMDIRMEDIGEATKEGVEGIEITKEK